MATATRVRISPGEYLRTSYRPCRDYVDGVVEERNLGELNLSAEPEALQGSPTRLRVVDVCVIATSAPHEQIIQTPPVAIIEVLSPDDRVSRYLARLRFTAR
jgi:hypothetical protein